MKQSMKDRLRWTATGTVALCLLTVIGCGGVGSFGSQDVGETLPELSGLEPMVRTTVRNALERLAICNDGSPYVYYLRPGTGNGSTKWIIHLKGGGSCMNAQECRQRGPSLTQPPDAPTKRGGGILLPSAEENPNFYNWNHVFMPYCSSDTWVGDRPASAETGGLHFRGSRIVTAVIEDLSDPTVGAPRLDRASEVIFSGSSAGGGGMANNLNRVMAMLPEGTPFAGIVDSAYPPKVEPYVPYSEQLIYDTHNRASFWNAVVDAVCLGATGDPLQCLGAVKLMPYLQAPVFVYYDQADKNRLPKMGITDPRDPDQQAWVLDVFAPAVRSSLTDTTDGCYSTFQGKHTAVAGPAFYSMKVDGLSYHDVFVNWYFKTGGPTKVIVDGPQF